MGLQARKSYLMVVAVLAPALIVGACGSSKMLSRDKAGQLISTSEKWKEPRQHIIILGTDFRGQYGAGFVDWNLVDAFVGLGYLREANREIQLTDKGRAAEGQWEQDPNLPAGRLIPMVDREFIGVNGIVQADGSTDAEGEFKWRWKWTPLVEKLFHTGGEPDTTDLVMELQKEFGYQEGAPGSFPEQTGKALFRRYDDGWRLETLQF